MKIIDKKVSELLPYANNPRRNDPAVDAVAASIREFGFKVPIVIDSNNEIIAGHTRLKAAKRLGLQTVPCIIADDLTPEQVKAFRLADNKVSELAEWDLDLLSLELEGLPDFDIEQFEFEESEELYNFNKAYFDEIIDRYKTIRKIKRGDELWQVVAQAEAAEAVRPEAAARRSRGEGTRR